LDNVALWKQVVAYFKVTFSGCAMGNAKVTELDGLVVSVSM